MKLLAVTCVAVVVLAGRSVVAQEEEVLSQVRLADMWKVVEVFSKLDRTSSSAGEREAAEYLKAQLEHYGIRHRMHEVRSYLSVPVSASLQILSPSNFSVPSITPSFSGSTGSGGLSGELVYVGPEEPNIVTTRDEDFVDAHLEGKVALLRGYPSPRLLREAEASGALGAVCIAPSPRLVNMIVSRVWGHPTQEEARQLTKIPVVTINETDGFRLEALGRDGRVSVRLEAEIDTGWKNIPLLVAEVPGTETPEQFVLIGNHLDAWYEGVTDSATGNASLLEVARVLHENRQRMRRSVRIAWWPGHSTGRYSGSTWYADAFFQDLYDNAVAYLAIDSPGVRSATAIEAEGMFEAKGFLDSVLRDKAGVEREATRSFRYNDEALWGIGVPSLTFYPAIPLGHPDRAKDAGGSAYGYWWHTKEDDFEKADKDLLVRDTKLYVALVWPLTTDIVLPFDFTPVAIQMRETIEELARAAEGHWDFEPTLNRIALFEETARHLRRRSLSARVEDAPVINSLLMKMSREINPVLYTVRGPYYHDPAYQLPLFPGLRGAKELGAIGPSSDEAGFIQTELLRESNRIHQALDRAIALGREK